MSDLVAVGGEDYGAYLEAPLGNPSSAFDKFFGFLDGVRGVTDRVEGITGDVAGTVDRVADTRRTLFELERDKAMSDQDRQLERLTTERGDNVQLYYVVGAVALLGVIMIAR